MACSMCSGTDCADACNQGQCYAEEMQRREMEDEVAREEWEQQLRDDDRMRDEENSTPQGQGGKK